MRDQGDDEKRAAMEKLACKYVPANIAAHRKEAISREWKPLCMLEMSIEHITGREAIELTVKKSSMHMWLILRQP